YVDAAGNRHQPTSYFPTKREARAWLNEQHTKADQGQLADAGRRTVGDWLTEWLTIKKPQVESNTFIYYEQNARIHLQPALGRTPLAKLRSTHVARLYAALTDKGVSPATQKHVGITLSSALNDAVKMGLIPSNPARSIKKPKVQRHEIHPLDA